MELSALKCVPWCGDLTHIWGLAFMISQREGAIALWHKICVKSFFEFFLYGLSYTIKLVKAILSNGSQDHENLFKYCDMPLENQFKNMEKHSFQTLELHISRLQIPLCSHAYNTIIVFFIFQDKICFQKSSLKVVSIKLSLCYLICLQKNSCLKSRQVLRNVIKIWNSNHEKIYCDCDKVIPFYDLFKIIQFDLKSSNLFCIKKSPLLEQKKIL